MTVEFKLYLNDHYYDSFYNRNYYGDRVEFFRDHERSLWTIYQILKTRIHVLTITDVDKNIKERINNEDDFKNWVQIVYPGFEGQLDKLVSTKYPHPKDKLTNS